MTDRDDLAKILHDACTDYWRDGVDGTTRGVYLAEADRAIAAGFVRRPAPVILPTGSAGSVNQPDPGHQLWNAPSGETDRDMAIKDIRAASQEIASAARLMTDAGASPGIARSLAIHARRLSAAADAIESKPSAPAEGDRDAVIATLVAEVERFQAMSERATKERDEAREKVERLFDKMRDWTDKSDAEIRQLRHEVEVLRQYGNKDCTAMADAAIKSRGPA